MGSIMKSIKGARGVATFAALGNLLQGWDGGAIAGQLLCSKTALLCQTPRGYGLLSSEWSHLCQLCYNVEKSVVYALLRSES